MKTKAMIIVLVTLLFTLAGNVTGGGAGEQDAAVRRFVEGASLENGRSIYLKGINLLNQQIPISEGPHWLYRHGGGCASCHGRDGKGGLYPMMCWEKTPAITYRSLVSGEHGHDDEHGEGGGKEEEDSWDVKALWVALREGVEPDGDTLDRCMPRWHISYDDFRDLVRYLIHLDAGTGDNDS